MSSTNAGSCGIRPSRESARRIAADPEKQALTFFNPLSWRRRGDRRNQCGLRDSRHTPGEGGGWERTPTAHQLLKVRHMGRQSRSSTTRKPGCWSKPTFLAPVHHPLRRAGARERRANYIDEPADHSGKSLCPAAARAGRNRESGRHGREACAMPGPGNPVYYSVAEQETWQYHGGPVSGKAR